VTTYLIHNEEGFYLIKNKRGNENLKHWELTGDFTLLLTLIDKYFYKKTRHENYVRDESLGKDDDLTKDKIKKSLTNITTIRKAIEIVLEVYAINQNNEYQEVSDDDLLMFLHKHEDEQGCYYGDDLSDDSDEEDSIVENLTTGKFNHFKLIAEIQDKEKFFWNTTWRTTPLNCGLEDRLEILINDKDITPEKLKKITTDLIDRARKRSTLILDTTAKNDFDELNETIKQGKEDLSSSINNVKTKFFITGYRGINYMTDRWSADSRRFHRNLNELYLPQYSEMVLKTLPYCFYTELSSKNDFTTSKDDQISLNLEASQLINFMYGLRNYGSCIDYAGKEDKKSSKILYIFNNVGDCLQDWFSNGINQYLGRYQQLRITYPQYWGKNLQSAHNPNVAFGNIPYHSLKYTYALKEYYPNSIDARYHRDGTLEYSHVGKVYAAIFSLEEIIDKNINRVSEMDRQGRINIDFRIAPEKETSFLSFVEADKIFYQLVAKYPSFKKNFDELSYDIKSIYQYKYGLNEKLYTYFKRLIALSKPNSLLRAGVIKLLSEWLCAYQETLLVKIAKKEAEKRGGVLVYLAHDGLLSLESDKGIFTNGDDNIDLRNEVHIKRNIRQLIATHVKNDNDIIEDTKTCPGFSIYKEEDIQKTIETIKSNDHSLLEISKKFKLTKTQETEGYIQRGYEKNLKIKTTKTYIEEQSRLKFFKQSKKQIYHVLDLRKENHLYDTTEIDALLEYSLSNKATWFSAVTPLVQGKISEEAIKQFNDALERAFRNNISVIPINTTSQKADDYRRLIGTHWVGLVIRKKEENNSYEIEYIDSAQSPDSDEKIDTNDTPESNELLNNTQLVTIFTLIKNAAQRANKTISTKILSTEQQIGDLDCGAWMVDNISRRAQGLEIRSNRIISGLNLRKEHFNQIQKIIEQKSLEKQMNQVSIIN
jgi:hypothetical protein